MVRHRPSGDVVTLVKRKTEEGHAGRIPFHPGWWIEGPAYRLGSGLADFVIDAEDGDWEVVGGDS